MPRIDRDSPIPAYYQIALDLQSRMSQGEWSPGGQLPSAQTLCSEYEVSYMTMHQALSELTREGVLVRQRGAGTFVSNNYVPVVPTLSFPISFTMNLGLRQQGFTPSNRLLEGIVMPAPSPEIAKHLQIAENAEVACLKRIHLSDDQPVAVNRSFVSSQLCPNIIELGLIDGSISKTFTLRYNLTPTRAEHWLEAKPATDEEVSLLNVDANAPMLVLMTLSFLADARPLEFSITSWAGERMRLHFEMKAEHEKNSTRLRSRN